MKRVYKIHAALITVADRLDGLNKSVLAIKIDKALTAGVKHVVDGDVYVELLSNCNYLTMYISTSCKLPVSTSTYI